MLEKEITIKTGEGQINTFIVHPDEDGPHPVILFLMDAPGKREELHQMARELLPVDIGSCCQIFIIVVSQNLFQMEQIKVVRSCLSTRIVLVMRW